VTLDLNNIMTVFIDFMSSGLAHAKDALECPLDERIMMTMARGRRYTGMGWSGIKS
jgi:hypothetical protein